MLARRASCPRDDGLGVRDQVGRRAGGRLRRGRPAAAREPQRQTTSRRATPSCARSAARSAPTRRCSTARSWLRERPAELPAPAGAHAPPAEAQIRRLAQSEPGRLHDLRPALPRRPLAAGAALRGPPRGCSRARATGPTLAGARPPRRRRRRRCSRLAARRGSRASSPSGSTPRTCPAAAPRAG